MKPKKGFWKLAGLFSALSVFFLSGCSELAVLNPQGPVAKEQADLIVWSLWMMAIVVVVVFAIFAYVLIKYRERPDNMDYEPPEQEGNLKMEIIWTAFPIIILILLAIPTVKSIYALEEPPKNEQTKIEEPLTIHVTSANWKWIFSYPEENIETVNYVNIPEDRPVRFELTSQGSMNSFWVPELGGQKYSMNNMAMDLYLQADNPGSYIGRSANFSGEHFTDMEFEVLAQTHEDYEEWVDEVKATAKPLTEEKYDEIIEPGVVGRMTFNGTHLEWVNHAKDAYIPGKVDERGMNMGHGNHNHGSDDSKKESHDEHEGHDEHAGH
ncbi:MULTISPECIES: cytochrome aa3 quinol oxidase subunit II [Bacillaceae]|uniref:cytochrome aa3 quinol oxidase subunit II n=1 Tax=Bacillaceae TaxID=186817 RepID=UPI00104CFE51|nr:MULTISPECIES: cytochrome aa3 quinol oxidase subunit II [Bacillaceae]MDT2046294.1 cytochrome aa3 quinol oxidase subunit II [Priestia flexa]TDB50021.1 cytochrome aa3 quinol oxidase subunit II [Bacillus sp. CBEL-1]USY53683.1 cytochrome aa3 quinol oxidase subunit II [Bacillus sp. 1780r2a1]